MRNHVNSTDREVAVNRIKLLAKMEENRTKHAVVFDDAMGAYHSVMRNALIEMSQKALALSNFDTLPDDSTLSKLTNLIERHHKPVSYLTAYDEVIEMFKWETSEEITLSVSEFRKFVLDKWDWQENFMATNSAYITAARR